MNNHNLCRLCARPQPKTHLVNIDDAVALNLNLSYKIQHCFQLKIEENDLLPKSICSTCCDQVMITYDFVESIHKAQDTLRTTITGINLLSCPVSTSVETKHEFKPETGSTSDHDSCSTHDFVECLLSESEMRLPKTDSILDERDNVGELKEDILTTDEKLPLTKNKRRICSKQKTDHAKRRKKRKTNSKHEEMYKEDAEDSDTVSLDLSESFNVTMHEDGTVTLNPPVTSWNSYPWTCCHCQNQLSSLSELREHHTTVHKQPAQYSCVDCGKPPYSIYQRFIAHVKSHRPYLTYCCDVCGNFYRRQRIMEHHRLSHSELSDICQKCGKNYRSNSSHCLHSKPLLPHSDKNQYACDLCSKKFGTKPNLVAHKRIHAGIKEYTCDQCGKSFIQKGNLENHLLTHTAARPYKCELCSKTFKTIMRLKKHESVHSGLKPHQCDICGRQFREKGTLKEHHRIHTGARPFSCEFCGKCFRFKGVLTTHRRQHTGERPYSCVECQHHFTNWPNYNKHMKRRHGINTSVTVRKPQTIPPTGMPCRNPPGTVIVPPVAINTAIHQPLSQTEDIPNSQMLILQDNKNVQLTSSPLCSELDQTSYISTAGMSSTLDVIKDEVLNVSIQQQSPTTTIVGTTVLSVSPQQSYYMPSLLGLYNIQTVDPSQLMAQQR